MQYIQLQGQVASQLDLPIAGGYNLFIDTADNTIKAKDNNGNLTGVNQLQEVTKAQLDAHIISCSLTPGTFYKITGVGSGSYQTEIQEGGTTIILQAASTSSLNPKGVGLFWNPKYSEYNVWNQTFEFVLDRYIYDVNFDMEEYIVLDAPSNMVLKPNILDNTAIANLTNTAQSSFFTDNANYPILFYGDNTGITGSLTGFNFAPSFSVGNKVIWGNRVWSNLNGNIGYEDGEFNLGTEDWQVVPYNPIDYNLAADIIEYDYANNNISYRKDVNHNIEVSSNYWEMDGYTNYIRQFPFGHPNIHNVSLENTYTDNLVNIDNTNQIDGLYLKSNTRFGANYWGKYNRFYDIVGETQARISNLSIGKWTTFKRLKLGINSNFGGYDPIYVVGNDGNTITDITLGSNCNIYGLNMLQYSYLDNIIMGDDSEIYNMIMHYDTRIQNIDMGLNTSLNSISFGNGSYLNNTNLDASSYISSLNLDVNAEMYNISLGRNSYIEYSSLGTNCSIYDISFGVDASMYCNTLYNTDGLSSTINNISLGDNSGIGGIQLYGSTYISDINGSNNTGFSGLTITGSNSYLANFEIEQNGGFGGFTIDGSQSSVVMDNFKIGQDNGFGGIGNVTSSMSNITIERGFNNMWNTQTFTGVTQTTLTADYSGNASNLPYLNIDVKGVVVLDITNTPAESLNYRLGSGQYEGQELTFVVKNTSGAIYATSTDIRVWCDDLLYPLQYNQTGYVQNCSFAPFAHYDPTFNSGQWVWRTMGKAIWTNGMWVTDSEYYYD